MTGGLNPGVALARRVLFAERRRAVLSVARVAAALLARSSGRHRLAEPRVRGPADAIRLGLTATLRPRRTM